MVKNLDNQALEGAFSIFGMTIILLLLVNVFANEFLNQYSGSNQYSMVQTSILLSIIIIVGLVNGYIFREKVKKAILYFVGLGELILIGLFILFYGSVQQQLGNSATTPTDAIGFIIIAILLLAILIGGAIGLVVFGVVIYIPAIVGKRLRERN